MDPPEGAIEIAEGTMWMEDGIVIGRHNGGFSTAEMVEESFAAAHSLIGGIPRPLLWDIRNWQGATPGWWKASIENLDNTYTAASVLIDPESSPDIGPYKDAIGLLMIPIEYFTDETDALAFVRGFLPDE